MNDTTTKFEMMLRKMIIDDDIKELKTKQHTMLKDFDYTEFLYNNLDICLRFNDDNTEMAHLPMMLHILSKGKINEDAFRDISVALYNGLKDLNKTKDEISVENFNKSLELIYKLFVNIFSNRNNNIDPLLKTMIMREFRKTDLSEDKYRVLLRAMVRYGIIDDQLINDQPDLIDYYIMSQNNNIPLRIIDQFNNKDYDWCAISHRSDLNSRFIIKYQDKLDFVVILYNNYLKDNITWKCITNILLCDNKDELDIRNKIRKAKRILTESPRPFITYHEHVIISHIEMGKMNWKSVHMIHGLSEEFILKYADKLNILDILKYYKLSEETRAKLVLMSAK